MRNLGCGVGVHAMDTTLTVVNVVNAIYEPPFMNVCLQAYTGLVCWVQPTSKPAQHAYHNRTSVRPPTQRFRAKCETLHLMGSVQVLLYILPRHKLLSKVASARACWRFHFFFGRKRIIARLVGLPFQVLFEE